MTVRRWITGKRGVKAWRVATVCALALLLIPAAGLAQFRIDVESGVVSAGYNDVRIPGDEGTLFSLSEGDLSIDPSAFFRARLEYTFGERHTFSALYAPLSAEATGVLSDGVAFAGEEFPAGTDVDGTYTFNSYRLTYRYELRTQGPFEAGVGFTAKIRDAEIRVEGDGLSASKTNVGFVPLLNFRLRWQFRPCMALLLQGDALAAPQGRAEDVTLALLYDLNDRIALRAGYRIVEGGADNDEVYNFALLNYISAGVTVSY
ncbi:MAG: hypothetical protein GF400_04400 [Candidatus Eisenbacteria bacterium]|nr:hypothetical protein [Candidatus Eisenbacteria bacterium]